MFLHASADMCNKVMGITTQLPMKYLNFAVVHFTKLSPYTVVSLLSTFPIYTCTYHIEGVLKLDQEEVMLRRSL